VLFDTWSVEYASHSTCIVSPEAYLDFYESDDTYKKNGTRCDKYASHEAIQDECEAYSTLHESDITWVRDHFYSASFAIYMRTERR
jgi:hypothetical protein